MSAPVPTLVPMTSPLPRTQHLVPAAAAALDAILGRLQRGYGDASLRRVGAQWWRASTTPEGPVLLRLQPVGADVEVSAQGPGAQWALAQAPRLLGRDDRPELFASDHRLLGQAVRRPERWRLGATDRLAEALAPVVIEQKVTGREAFTSIRRLIRRFGAPAPGAEDPSHPAHGLHCSPDAAGWMAIPRWEFVQVGVDDRRAATLTRAMSKVAALERLMARAQPDATSRGESLQAALVSLPGIGVWTAAKVRQQVLGDPDAWSVDDYHVPGMVALHLGGDPAEQLDQFRPHRYRVELALMRLGLPERHGARRSLPTHLPVRGGW